MEKIKSGKVLRIALAILVAVAVWLYVDSVKAPDVRVKANNIPVEFSGENDTLADKGLMILSGYDTTIDLTLKGPRKVLWKLDKSEIRIVADTSGISDTGVKTLRYNVVYPDAVSGSQIKVENASAFTVTVTVGELSTKKVPVECEVLGEPAAGFITGDLSLDPAVLMLRASRDPLQLLKQAKTSRRIHAKAPAVPIPKDKLRLQIQLIRLKQIFLQLATNPIDGAEKHPHITGRHRLFFVH